MTLTEKELAKLYKDRWDGISRLGVFDDELYMTQEDRERIKEWITSGCDDLNNKLWPGKAAIDLLHANDGMYLVLSSDYDEPLTLWQRIKLWCSNIRNMYL